MTTFVHEMNNTRFATALHVLTLLAANTDEWLSSDYIAGSININPAMVRKELSFLQQGGFVIGRKGKEGGAKLSRNSDKILLADIYTLVKNSDILGKKNLQTNPKCPIGKQINTNLDSLFTETDRLVTDYLKKQTLADFVRQFH